METKTVLSLKEINERTRQILELADQISDVSSTSSKDSQEGAIVSSDTEDSDSGYESG